MTVDHRVVVVVVTQTCVRGKSGEHALNYGFKVHSWNTTADGDKVMTVTPYTFVGQTVGKPRPAGSKRVCMVR